MPRQSEHNKDEIKLAIAEHLQLNGPGNWEAVQDRFPKISRATFFRFVAQVREEMEAAASDRGAPELRMMQKRILARTQTPAQAEKKLKANVPTAPSPQALLGLGRDADLVFDFMANFNQILSDINLLRAASVTRNEDGSEKLKNPMLMDKTVGRRLEVIETWLRSQDLVWNLEKMRELFHVITEEVGRADPATQMAILARIRAVNNRQGLTVDARLN